MELETKKTSLPRIQPITLAKERFVGPQGVVVIELLCLPASPREALVTAKESAVAGPRPQALFDARLISTPRCQDGNASYHPHSSDPRHRLAQDSLPPKPNKIQALGSPKFPKMLEVHALATLQLTFHLHRPAHAYTSSISGVCA